MTITLCDTRIRRVVSWRSIVAVTVVCASISGAHAKSERTEFVEAYRCFVASLLDSILMKRPPAHPRERLLLIRSWTNFDGSVRCAFIENDTKMVCHASSGYVLYNKPESGRREPSADTIDALHALGFARPDTNSDFQLELRIGTPPNLDSVAKLMLKALYDAYGPSTVEAGLRFDPFEGDFKLIGCQEAARPRPRGVAFTYSAAST